jgi:P2 family phage contractile tail tube protein
MALPRDTKNWNVYVEGRGYMGEASEVTPPKLARKMDEFRGGGMDGAIKIDMGQEAMQGTLKIRGESPELVRKWGVTSHDGVGIRLRRAVASDTGGSQVQAVEEVWRGRFSEIDQGSYKSGEPNEKSYTVELSYYKLTIDGQVITEIDTLNMICIVDGVDVLAKQRQAIGL